MPVFEDENSCHRANPQALSITLSVTACNAVVQNNVNFVDSSMTTYDGTNSLISQNLDFSLAESQNACNIGDPSIISTGPGINTFSN